MAYRATLRGAHHAFHLFKPAQKSEATFSNSSFAFLSEAEFFLTSRMVADRTPHAVT